MIPGVYWYFGFPEGLYRFEHFTFKQGYGGHAMSPAELVTYLTCDDPEAVLQQLKTLTDRYPEAHLFVYRDGNKLTIGTGGFQLHDYDFLFIGVAESLLIKAGVVFLPPQESKNWQFTRLSGNNRRLSKYPAKGRLQVVGSSLRKHHAETLSLRLDCHVRIEEKTTFIAALKGLCQSLHLPVFYYFQYEGAGRTDLMLFFTNGRQGLGLQEKQYLDMPAFEAGVEAILEQWQAVTGHHSQGLYEGTRQPFIELMIDREFVLDE